MQLAQDDIKNISGSISGADIYMKTTAGDIINKTASARSVLRDSHLTLLGDMATIKASGNLTLDSGNNIHFTGSSADAQKSIYALAKKDIILDIVDASSKSVRGWKSSRHSTDFKSSSLTSGGDLLIDAGNNVNLKATEIMASKNIQIGAGNDILLETATRTSNESFAYNKVQTKTVNHTGTNISGANVVLNSGNDLNMVSATIGAANSLTLKAGNDINAINASDSYYYKKIKESGGAFNSKKTTTQIYNTTAVLNDFSAGGNMNIVSDGSTTLQGVNANVGGDLQIKTGEDLNVIAGL